MKWVVQECKNTEWSSLSGKARRIFETHNLKVFSPQNKLRWIQNIHHNLGQTLPQFTIIQHCEKLLSLFSFLQLCLQQCPHFLIVSPANKRGKSGNIVIVKLCLFKEWSMNGIEAAMEPLREDKEKSRSNFLFHFLFFLLSKTLFSFHFVPDGPSISITDLCNRPYGFFIVFFRNVVTLCGRWVVFILSWFNCFGAELHKAIGLIVGRTHVTNDQMACGHEFVWSVTITRKWRNDKENLKSNFAGEFCKRLLGGGKWFCEFCHVQELKKKFVAKLNFSPR